jgi:hypothetical protein
LRFVKGQPKQVHWAGRLRSFCPDCGSPLTFLASPDSEEIDVTVCSFDDPSVIKPAAHIWIEDKLRWIELADHLPTHIQQRRAL